MPYAVYHRKEKERERNIRRKAQGKLYIPKDKINWNKGKNNPRWKGGITSFCLQIRNSERYKRWRIDVFKRDRWACCNCHTIGGNLNAHHIKQFKKILEENNITTIEEAFNCKELWSLDNGITLCENCHKLTRRLK